MIILLSPAKTLDFEKPLARTQATEPRFVDQSAKLIRELKKQSVTDIRQLMKLSEPLAKLNTERYRSWKKAPDHAATRQAIFAFRGDVYQGFDADSMTARDLTWAQKRVRILSGLYGLLRPLDRMQPYRLEMGTKLANQRGSDLYAFWRDRLSAQINDELTDASPKVVINLASNEYFNAVDAKALDARVISPRFLDYSRDDYRIVSFFAKRARGAMAGWLVRERVKTLKAIAGFDQDGYRFSAEHSKPDQPTFIRDKQA